ncbi:hypothetical protein [Ornithinicoccus hortensis]|uniref:Uncharacterized protein n=1 Tax=Ornithinicoccus hortensis TaxID=82346 RepID=A0A542YMI9_9MICO|nr:hypothetical protein [Ornithinicoccus hortensis]TQL49261.1 hypothetical protein FB467_0326 [Ornithinicoccus hortensis]
MTPHEAQDAHRAADGTLPQALRAALSTAIRGRDRTAVSALRSAIAAVENAEASPLPAAPETSAGADPTPDEPRIAGSSVGLRAGETDRLVLTAEEVARIVTAEVTDREAAAQEMAALGREDRAERLREEADVIRRVLDARPAPGTTARD